MDAVSIWDEYVKSLVGNGSYPGKVIIDNTDQSVGVVTASCLRIPSDQPITITNKPYETSRKSGKKTMLGKIKNVIFNAPATIVFWADGSKTVVKCENEAYNPEKGLAMAIVKKFFGDNCGYYYEVFKKWCPKEPEITIDYVDYNEYMKDKKGAI